MGLHGGYLTAVAVRGATAAVPDRPVRTLATSFIRSARSGPAQLRIQEVRRGRSASTVTAELWQAGGLLTSTRVTLIDPTTTGTEWAPLVPVNLPPPAECVPVTPPNPIAHFERATGLLDPATVPFSGGEQARIAGWIRPLEPRPVDAAWLAVEHGRITTAEGLLVAESFHTRLTATR